MYVYVIPIPVNRVRSPVAVIPWVIPPIPWRVVRTVAVNPEYIEQYGSCYINRFVNVVSAIHIHIADYLNLYIVVTVPFDLNGGHVLKCVCCQYGL